VGAVLTLVGEGGEVPRLAPYGVFVAIVVADLVYLVLARRVGDLKRFAAIQIAIDGLFETILCYLTGGIYSFAAILYFGSILSASLCVSGRMSVAFAAGATAALSCVQVGYHFAVLRGFELPLVPPTVIAEHSTRIERVAAYLVAQGLALHLVAGLSSWLAQELSRVKVLYGEILEKMAEGLIAIDARRRLVFVNSEALRLLQYRKADNVIGRDLRDVFRRKQDRDILESLDSEKPMTVEVAVTTREGKRLHVEVKTSVLHDERGARRGTIGIFTDLTLKKQAEDAERRAERLEGIETLAVGIAHGVRNPLASIRGCVQELGRLDYLGDDERALAKIVCRESDRLDAIIAEFMRFARLKPPEPEDVELANLIRDVALLLKARVNERAGAPPIRIDLDLIENAHLRADPKQLTQVLLNLGINAIESMEKEGGTVSISLRDTRSVRHAPTPRGGFRILEDVRAYDIVVEDTGPGIDVQDLVRIFEPFYTTKPGGTGLGLPIAERIVKQHGGTLTAESMPDCGATFRICLPVLPAPDGSPPAKPPARAADARGPLANTQPEW